MDYTPAIDSELLKQVVQHTDSSVVLIFVVLSVLALPILYFWHKNNKHRHEVECSRRDKDREREQNIIQVITANTEVMAGLKATLEANNSTLKDTIVRIHDRIDLLVQQPR